MTQKAEVGQFLLSADFHGRSKNVLSFGEIYWPTFVRCSAVIGDLRRFLLTNITTGKELS